MSKEAGSCVCGRGNQSICKHGFLPSITQSYCVHITDSGGLCCHSAACHGPAKGEKERWTRERYLSTANEILRNTATYDATGNRVEPPTTPAKEGKELVLLGEGDFIGQAPESWDADYRRTWAQLQATQHNLTQYRAAYESLRTTPAQGAKAGEPDLCQVRMRPMWDNKAAWTPWKDISVDAVVDYERLPIHADWQREARRLYTHPAPPHPDKGSREALSAEQIFHCYRAAQQDEDEHFHIAFAREIEKAHGIGAEDDSDAYWYCPQCDGKIPDSHDGVADPNQHILCSEECLEEWNANRD